MEILKITAVPLSVPSHFRGQTSLADAPAPRQTPDSLRAPVSRPGRLKSAPSVELVRQRRLECGFLDHTSGSPGQMIKNTGFEPLPSPMELESGVWAPESAHLISVPGVTKAPQSLKVTRSWRIFRQTRYYRTTNDLFLNDPDNRSVTLYPLVNMDMCKLGKLLMLGRKEATWSLI